MIISASKVLPLQHLAPPIDDGAIAVSRGIILSVGRTHKIITDYPGHKVSRLENVILMPGLVNAHTHLELPPLLANTRSRSFADWVLNLIRAKKSLDQNAYKAAVIENIRSVIQSGTTTVGEICTHEVSPPLLRASGLRAVVFDEIIQMGRGRIQFRHPRIDSVMVKFGLSPHSPYTVSESGLRTIRAASQKKKMRLAMHIAESGDEMKLLQQKPNSLIKLYEYAHWEREWAPRGPSSIQYLNKLGFLSPHLLAVHAVWVTQEDIKLIKKAGTSVAHCPRSNKELGVGRMPLKAFLDADVAVGLGTDSLASSPTLNMWDEMRYAYKIHKHDGITPLDIVRLATNGGAKALGLEREIGVLRPGMNADIIAVPLPKKKTADLFSDLLRETKSCNMSMINGKILFRI